MGGGGFNWSPINNIWYTLFTVSLPIADTGQESDLAWYSASTFISSYMDGPVTETLTGSGDISLPVELSMFSAEVVLDDILLKWTTESEVDNVGFILERKSVETGWQTIATYKFNSALQSQGNTSQSADYEFMDVTAQSNTTYQYRLSDVNTGGKITILDALEITMNIHPLHKTRLEPAYPNPFNPQTKISYKLAEEASVSLNVYDINGRQVSCLMDGVQQSPGSYSIHWNSKNDLGQNVVTGTYILRMIAGDVVETQKLLLIR